MKEDTTKIVAAGVENAKAELGAHFAQRKAERERQLNQDAAQWANQQAEESAKQQQQQQAELRERFTVRRLTHKTT